MSSSRGRSYCSSPLLISDGRWKESFCYLEKAPEFKQTEDPVATPCTTGYEWTREEYVAASKENEVVIHNLFVGRTRSIPSSKTDFQGPQHWGVESNQKVMRTSTPVCSEAFKVQSQVSSSVQKANTTKLQVEDLWCRMTPWWLAEF